MIFGKTKMEFKVGIFVFIGVFILVFFVLSIGGFKTWVSGYRFGINFHFVNGVKVGAPVRFAGVDVGEVKRIQLNFLPQENRMNIRLDVWVKDIVRIPIDSTVWVNTLGLLGEKYIEIIPGKDYAHCLKAHDALAGTDPMPLHVVFRSAENILSNLDAGLAMIKNKEGSLGKLIYDDTIYNELQALVTDIRKNPWKLFFKTKEVK